MTHLTASILAGLMLPAGPWINPAPSAQVRRAVQWGTQVHSQVRLPAAAPPTNGTPVATANVLGGATNIVTALGASPTPPEVTLQPRSQAAFMGMSVTFEVDAKGTAPLHCQWQEKGLNLEGATNLSLTVPVTGPDRVGPYRAVINNEAGSTNSLEAQVVLVPVAAWGWNTNNQTELPFELTNAVQVAAGPHYNVALLRDGAVFPWGAAPPDASWRQLRAVRSVCGGYDFGLALMRNGTVSAWGQNVAARITMPRDLSTVVAVTAGSTHALALKADGRLVGWGMNTWGQATPPAGLSNIVAIAAGTEHSLALRADGRVFAWGKAASGQTAIPTDLPPVLDIAAGAAHSLALDDTGRVFAWGGNSFGQASVPAGLSNVIAIAAGAYHSLALQSDGSLVAWGAGKDTRSGTFPHFGQSVTPAWATNLTAMSGGQGHTIVISGYAPFVVQEPMDQTIYSGRSACFRAAATGAMPLSYQWQRNGIDLPGATQLWLRIEESFTPQAGEYSVVVSNSLGVATSQKARLKLRDQAPFILTQPASVTGRFDQDAALEVMADGSGPLRYQWRLGGNNIPGATDAVLKLTGLRFSQTGSYSVVVSNEFGTVTSQEALLTVAQVVAWGAGTNWSGFGNFGQAAVPAGLGNVVKVAGGGYHSLALRKDGTVAAWGAGTNYPKDSINYAYGQAMVPPGLSNVVGIAAGGYHSLALKGDGTVIAWGAGTSNYFSTHFGQSIVPDDLNSVVAIAAGTYYSMALRNNGRVVLWGGQDVFRDSLAVPEMATNVIAIASHNDYALALKANGDVVTWGRGRASLYPNFSGSNGVAVADSIIPGMPLALKTDGLVASSSAVTPPLSNIVQIATGTSHGLALRRDGTLVMWGATNANGLGRNPDPRATFTDIAAGANHCLAVIGDGAPIFKPPLQEVATEPGKPAVLGALAVGAPPLSYQWRLHGQDLPGATNPVLAWKSATLRNAGAYQVVVTNHWGAATSAVTRLAILLPLAQAVDAPELGWTCSGALPWRGLAGVGREGLGAAQSGRIADTQQSSIQATVEGPGTLSFWWKVSSEPGFDFLSFAIDDQKHSPISGEVDWRQETYAIPPGAHVLKWIYYKDVSQSGGLDAAWLDEVTFTVKPPAITAQPLNQIIRAGANAWIGVQAAGAAPLSFQWRRDGKPIPGATQPSLVITKASRLHAGTYAVLVTNPGGSILSSNATLRVLVSYRLASGAWEPTRPFTLQASDPLGGSLQPEDLDGLEAWSSTNLMDWAPLPNGLSLTNGLLLLADPESTNQPVRFYRLRAR